MVLIDGGATYNFIDVSLVSRKELATKEFSGFSLVIPGNNRMECTKMIPKLSLTMGK